jgi:hypothetical protein
MRQTSRSKQVKNSAFGGKTRTYSTLVDILAGYELLISRRMHEKLLKSRNLEDFLANCQTRVVDLHVRADPMECEIEMFWEG